MTRCVPPAWSGLLAALLVHAPCLAQSGAVRAELGTATSLPAGEVEGDAAVYGVAGLTVDWRGRAHQVVAGLHGGLALDDRGSDFGTASLRGELWTGAGTALGVAAEAHGFEIRDPFRYRTGAMWGGPAARLRDGPLTVEIRGEVGAGRSLAELRRSRDGPARRRELDLWSRGVSAEARVESGPVSGTVEAGSWRTGGGDFRTLGLALLGGTASVAIQGDVALWDTPLGDEWVGGVAILVPLGGRVRATGAGGRAAPDPHTLVEAGGIGGLVLGVTVVGLGGGERSRVHELLPGGSGPGRRVRFRLRREEVRSVQILGDFTAWEPRPMAREGATWTLELSVPPGVHHFGFRVDGEWYVPPGLSGTAPDEWGRQNAILVVPDMEEEDR